MKIEAFESEATLISEGTTHDWENVQAVATLMMDALPLHVDDEWDYEYIALSAGDEYISAADLSEAYEDAYITHSIRDRKVTP